MDEKMRVLKMVEEGKITAEDAIKLFEAMESKNAELAATPSTGKTKFVKINVKSSDGEKVKVNLPVPLIDVALKVAGKSGQIDFNDVNIDVDDIVQMVKEGAERKILEVESDDGDFVEICVE